MERPRSTADRELVPSAADKRKEPILIDCKEPGVKDNGKTSEHEKRLDAEEDGDMEMEKS